MKLLMHICCAPCSLYPLQTLSSQNIAVKGLWFNPNIHPYTEYEIRLCSVQKLQTLWNLDIEYIEHYGLREFIRSVVHDEDKRCLTCYSIRLEETARIARQMGLDGFTTSLLVSPYQKFDMIVNIGKDIGERYSTRFYAEDFRIGWKEGVNLSKKLGLYSQKYCGCIYSEEERYTKIKKK